MAQFKNISPEELSENPFRLIGKDWMLITAGNEEKFNTMTASWGGVGVLWNKPVCFVFVRPSRYTYEFTENFETLSLCFFDESKRDVLKLCGSKSGREIDKVKECGLTPFFTEDGCVAFEDARLVLTCKKLYTEDMKEENFLDSELLKNYSSGDYHRIYVCEILSVMKQ